MFRCCNQGCLYNNDSKYGFAEHQARCKYSCTRASWKPAEKTVGAQKIQADNRLDSLGPSSIHHQLNSLDHGTIDCLENGNKFKEEQDFVVSAAECLLAICSSFGSSKIKTLFLLFQQQRSDPSLFRQDICSMVDWNKIAYDVLQRNLLSVNFQTLKVCVDRNVL